MDPWSDVIAIHMAKDHNGERRLKEAPQLQ